MAVRLDIEREVIATKFGFRFENGKQDLGGARIDLTGDDLKTIDAAAAQIEVHGARYPEHLQKMVGR